MPYVFLVMMLVGVVVMVQIGLLTVAFDKLGLSAEAGFLLLLGSLAGSVVNLPLFSITSDPPPPGLLEQYRRRSLLLPAEFQAGSYPDHGECRRLCDPGLFLPLSVAQRGSRLE